jgi:tetratricopeptide (TPR) repeat protein
VFVQRSIGPCWLLTASVATAAFGTMRLSAEEQPRPNVVLVTLESARGDRLGSYGYAPAATPALDRLAREGVRFTNATSPSPLTAPAHAGLLTGMYPTRFGVDDDAGRALTPAARTLAETLSSAGYRTGGFVGTFRLDARYGFAQGFERFDAGFAPFDETDKLRVQRPAAAVVASALEWIDGLPQGDPFFAWLQLDDGRAPAVAPATLRASSGSAAYDGRIAVMDAALARLVSRLEERGVLDRTIVVAVGDHGEGLGDHKEAEHGLLLYDSVLHVPWIMRLPQRRFAGTLVREQVRLIDVTPTLLDLAGRASPAGTDGESLVSLVGGGARRDAPAAYADTAYPQRHFGWSALASLRVGEWKYIEAPRPELYDLRVDAGERSNVAQTQPNVGSRMGADLRRLLSTTRTEADAASPPIAAETLERLRSLGYVGVAGPAGPSATGVDPKSAVAGAERIRRMLDAAAAARRRGRTLEAAGLFRQAIAIAEGCYEAHLGLGDIGLAQRQFDRALGEYEAAAIVNPASADPLLGEARALLRLGRADAARQKVDLAAELVPLSSEAAVVRAEISETAGRTADALTSYARAVELRDSDARARERLANLALTLRRLDVAAAQFTRLVSMRYRVGPSHFGLGRVAEARGDTDAAIRAYRDALAADPSLGAARAALARVRRK